MRSRRSPATSWPADRTDGTVGVVALGSGTVAAHGTGPKAALLDRAAAAGLPVPPGVVVLDGVAPPTSIVDGAGPTVGTFAVRSAFAAEDGAAASLAGWFDSRLRVAPADVPATVDVVRRSADRRAGTFRRDVLVMAMVEGRTAGVAFSEPGTYDDVVNATTGTAERLVAGEEEGTRVLLARLERVPAGWQRRLQRLLRRVRATFGDEAWDVEWVDDGRVCWLVQIRRITRPTRRDESFTIANHAEILPPLPSTLMTSVIAGAGPELFGWYRRAVPSLPANRDFLEVIAGRPFINLSLLEDMLRDLGLPTRLVADSIGGPPEVERPLRPFRVARALPSLLRLGAAQVTAVRRARHNEAAVVALGAQSMPTFADALRVLHDAYVALVTGMFPLSSAIGPPLALLRRTGTLQAHASRHRTVTTELADAVAAVGAGTLDRSAFLARFGHRGVYESDVACPRYADDPSVLPAAATAPPGAPAAASAPLRRRSLRVVLTLPLWWAARAPISAREQLRHESMRAFAAVRTALVDLATAAVDDGRLPTVEVLWTLTAEEARALDAGAVVSAADAAARAAERNRLAVLDPPPVVRRSDDPASWSPDAVGAGGSTWRGLALTDGTVRGRAWVLDEPAHELPNGFDPASTILVARSIDAGWVTTLTQVAAAVVETGGDLSHGSILVRELGLPAVTNVRGVRRGLTTGDEVEVRAGAGVVQRIGGEPDEPGGDRAPTGIEAVSADPPVWTRRTLLRQQWAELAYLHWPYDPDVVQRLLPDGLTVDTFDGVAWVGLIPFEMRDVRLGPLPPLPLVGRFVEINVRTYVVDATGRRSVWFFSLDVPRLAVVAVTRTIFSLPYRWAAATHAVDGERHEYRMTRRSAHGRGATARVAFTVGTRVDPAEVTDLDHFLTARWGLVTARGRRLLHGAVDHPRWPLCRVDDVVVDPTVVEAAGLPVPVGPPRALYSPGVPVRVAPFRRIAARIAPREEP